MSSAANRIDEPDRPLRERFLASWTGRSAAGADLSGGVLPTAAVFEAIQLRTAAADAAVSAAWHHCLAPACAESVALVAVGGFGRREQFPHSDVDLLILTGRDSLSPLEREAVSNALRFLWDSGFRVSQSVHTVAECCEMNEQNIELTISLLDQRFLAGSREVYGRLTPAFSRFLYGGRDAVARRLARLTRERHTKFGGSIYQLEPNIKEGPGGLRDYQVLCWLDQLKHSQADRFVVPEPRPELIGARNFFFGVRCYLHFSAGRDMNTLTFDFADEIAERFGVKTADWMRRYFGHARDLFRAAAAEIEAAEERGSGLLVQFKNWRSRVSNSDFSVARERVYLRAPHRLEYEPPLVLSLFQFVARHGIRLASETECRVVQHVPRLRRYFGESRPVLWPVVREILAGPHAALALRSMHETGVLAALFPEWEAVDCLVIRDFYHRYTVDEHTLAAIETIDSLGRPNRETDQRFTDLFSETENIAALKFALIFHDVGKGRDGPPVTESVDAAAAAMERIQVPAGERASVRRLIECHLELSAAMTSRDLDDPQVVRALAEKVGAVEELKRLTLLTYADIGAVNPAALTPWRREQLWRVYLAVHAELTRELDSDRISEPGGDMSAFLDGFPVRYLRTHSPEEIRAHAELEVRSRERGVAIEIERQNGYHRLLVITRDRPRLFAAIAGALASFGMNIVKAEGFANRRGAVLDTFTFTDPHRTLELNPTEMDRLRMMLDRVIRGRADVKGLLANRPKPAPPAKRSRVRPSVAFNQGASQTATLIEVVAEDRPGLLYALASVMAEAGLNIELLLIDTEAHKAIDVFYVTKSGRKLAERDEASLGEALRRACEGI